MIFNSRRWEGFIINGSANWCIGYSNPDFNWCMGYSNPDFTTHMFLFDILALLCLFIAFKISKYFVCYLGSKGKLCSRILHLFFLFNSSDLPFWWSCSFDTKNPRIVSSIITTVKISPNLHTSAIF